LSFPITDMDTQGQFDPVSFKNRIKWFLEHPISSIFVAGGTGEFFSLSRKEYQSIIEIAVDATNNKVPVISSIGRSIPEAIEFSKMAEKAGIDALYLLTGYLL